MPDKDLGSVLCNRLFLICPTDYIEQAIQNQFNGETYYYTALGVYFEWDHKIESWLWELICEQGIDQIVIVSAIDNIFYSGDLDKNSRRSYPIDEAVIETKKKLSKHLMQPEIFSSNLHLLVARHLANQKQRFLETTSLGSRIRSGGIEVKAYVYRPQEETFCSLEECIQRGNLLSSVSVN